MQLLIVDEKNPQRVIRLTVTEGDDGGCALSRGALDVEEIPADELFELLNEAPQQRTVIVRSSALKMHKASKAPMTWLQGL